MAKTLTLHTRIEPNIKEQADAILNRLGISTAEAINMFLHQVILYRGIPLDLRVPNTETIAAIRLTQQAGWLPVVSARSGETEDAFISHLAVATNAGQLKVGSFTRSERMVKWNEVLRIERLLGSRARFEGARIFTRSQPPFPVPPSQTVQ